MRRFNNRLGQAVWGGLAALALGLVGCKKDPDPYYEKREEPGAAILGLPSAPLYTKYAPGEVVPINVGYSERDQLATISVFQVVNKQDSAVVSTVPANGTYQPAAGLLVQVVPYTVPNVANAVPVRVDVTYTFKNGATRVRRFSYNVANSPTLRFGTPAAIYRTGLTTATEGDFISYNLVLNEGGVSTIPTPPPTPMPPLFKAVDSLTAFAAVGGGAPRRLGRVTAPTAGAANTRTVDVRVPAGSSGQSVVFVFVAYAQGTSATLTSGPVAVGAPAALATVRTGRVALGAGSAPDSVAFNLRTGQNEPAAGPATNKDLVLSGLLSPSGTPTLGAPSGNTTRYLRLSPTQLAATPYATATANAIGNLLYQNATSAVADLGGAAVGDVYAVRIRGAEPALLRVLAVRPGPAGAIARLRFEYRTP